MDQWLGVGEQWLGVGDQWLGVGEQWLGVGEQWLGGRRAVLTRVGSLVRRLPNVAHVTITTF